jgi:general secretion pathway protein M
MNQVATLQRLLTKPPLAAAAYVVMMTLLLFEIGSVVADILGRRADVAASAAMLDQFDGRRPSASRGQMSAVGGPSGSPFLQGATVTVAGAVLLQRVTDAVTKFGGNVLSSQVDLNGAQSKTGFLTIIASCEIDQPGLQQLIYDIEAGMPFLFIDQLAVQAASGFGASGEGKLRILLTVSGQWQGATR